MDVYVDAPAYALGERKTLVGESAEAGRLVSAPEDLEAAGFRRHHLCEPGTGAYDLARAATARLAATGGLQGIDAIVYSTCLPLNANAGDPDDWRRTGDVKHLMDFPGSRLQADFGLREAVVLGLGQQACTAALGSVRLAAALLRDEPGWRRVLCVTADRFPEGSRYEQAYNLISDGAAAFTVGRRTGDFELVTVHQITNGALGRAGDDETVGSWFSYTHRLLREALARAGLTPADLRWIVPQNTAEAAWRILARQLGVDARTVYAPTLADVGHVIAADGLVNLAELRGSGLLRPGQYLAVVSAGFGLNWQCLILRATEAVTAR